MGQAGVARIYCLDIEENAGTDDEGDAAGHEANRDPEMT